MSFFQKSEIVEQTSNFIGLLESGSVVSGNFGAQLELVVNALDHETKGPYKIWLKLPDEGKKIRAGSKLADFIEKLANLNYEITTNGTGQPKPGDLILHPAGNIFRWERGRKSFDGGKTTSEYTVPVESLTQEQADAEIKANGGIRRKGQAADGSVVVQSAAETEGPSDDDLTYVLEQFGEDGLARPGLVQVATKNGRVSQNKPLQKYIMSGKFVTVMVAAGRLVEDNGVFRSAE